MGIYICRCGERINDEPEGLSYRAHAFPDRIYESVRLTTAQTITSYIEARVSGLQVQWQENHFGLDYANLDLDEPTVIYDILAKGIDVNTLDVWRCISCGRLWVDHVLNGRRHLVAYFPEDDPPYAVFDTNGE